MSRGLPETCFLVKGTISTDLHTRSFVATRETRTKCRYACSANTGQAVVENVNWRKSQHENNALMRRPADDEAALAEAVDGEESDVRVLEVDEIKSVERVAAT